MASAGDHRAGAVSLSSEPRIQLLQDMAIQPKFREQEINTLFEDDRAMRPKIPGTVARGSLEEDDNYYHGFARQNDGNGKWTVVYVDSLPDRLSNTPKKMKALLSRGQQRFNIYCYVCHGYDGSGRGPVNQRAMELKAIDTDPQHPLGISWTPAAQITSDVIRAEPDGKFSTRSPTAFERCPAMGRRFRWMTAGRSSRMSGPFSSARAECPRRT